MKNVLFEDEHPHTGIPNKMSLPYGISIYRHTVLILDTIYIRCVLMSLHIHTGVSFRMPYRMYDMYECPENGGRFRRSYDYGKVRHCAPGC